VGFVGAVEAKYALKGISLFGERDKSIPYITNTNRKGGSAVAVSIVNAIIKLAKEHK
jgi:precorrin-8X/cobalt-precorrin-8 methylmutase